jgi:AcrR family transcriptional regulator
MRGTSEAGVGNQTQTRERGADQRVRIMEAAEEVILERGLGGARLRDVASRAGVSIGMVQHYFDSKDALLSETFHHRNHRRAQAWGAVAASQTDPWRKIEALIDNGVDVERIADSATIYFEFCAASSRDADLRGSIAASYDEWRSPTRAAIEQGIREGSFRPLLPTEEIVNTLAMTLDGAEIAVTIGAAQPAARLRETMRVVAATLLGYDGGVGSGKPGETPPLVS